MVVSFFSWQSQVLTEYVLVSDTSAVTVTVIGIFKDAVTILVCHASLIILFLLEKAFYFIKELLLV